MARTNVNPYIVVAAKYFIAGGTVTSANTPINAAILDKDDLGCVTTGANWRFTAPYSGWYIVMAAQYSGALQNLRLWKMGVVNSNMGTGDASTSTDGQTSIYLAKGEWIDVRPNEGATTNVATGVDKPYISVYGVVQVS